MAWLLRDEQVLAAIATDANATPRVRTTRWVVTRHACDVAYCRRGDDGSLVVMATRSMPRWRIGLPRLRAECILEAELGAFERWNLVVGDRLAVR